MYMIELELDGGRLARFAMQHGHLGIDEDHGYAAHAWLAATMGKNMFSPFRLMEKRGAVRLLGYSSVGINVIKDEAQAFSEPSAWSVCNWEVAASKQMPSTWTAGRRMGFEVRACPVSRGEKERDVFLVEVERTNAAGTESRLRAEIYTEWLTAQVEKEGAAKLVPGTTMLNGFRRVKGLRRSAVGHANIERPDALFTGQLTIGVPGSFAKLLERGVGRHRAFGFGMLLLRPAV